MKNVSKKERGSSEGIGPIAEGVKEPDKMEAGLLLTNDSRKTTRKKS